MKPNNLLKEYVRIMRCVDIEDSVKQQIIRNCARHGTLSKIRAGKYRVIAVKKEKISN
ncbi:MAG: hypothetical protein IJO03_09150 [Clostridia bacterium]|nr:hypothetical protein [Clostridia bacterium]